MARDREMTLAEAAARLRISYPVAYRLALVGELATTRRNGRWVTTREEVERLARERARGAAVASR